MGKIINIKEVCFDEKLVRAKDMGKIFVDIAPSTIIDWAKAGLLSRYKINGSVFYKLSEIKNMIENAKECV